LLFKAENDLLDFLKTKAMSQRPGVNKTAQTFTLVISFSIGDEFSHSANLNFTTVSAAAEITNWLSRNCVLAEILGKYARFN
jgi:hypothetical protein